MNQPARDVASEVDPDVDLQASEAGEPVGTAAEIAAGDPAAEAPAASRLDTPESHTPEPDAPESGSESAAAEPETAAARTDAYLADLQRVTAEFANFRRQTTKRHGELVAQAAAGLATALLPVLDACEAAQLQGVSGVEVIRTQLLGVLEGHGLEVLADLGRQFDPNRHEAVSAVEASEPGPADAAADAAPGPVVAEILRTGYAWKGRVLRPAMVRVQG